MQHFLLAPVVRRAWDDFSYHSGGVPSFRFPGFLLFQIYEYIFGIAFFSHPTSRRSIFSICTLKKFDSVNNGYGGWGSCCRKPGKGLVMEHWGWARAKAGAGAGPAGVEAVAGARRCDGQTMKLPLLLPPIFALRQDWVLGCAG